MDQKYQIKRHIAHFGAITFNYSMIGFIITIGSLLSVILSGVFLGLSAIIVLFYYFFLILAVIFSVGIILLSDKFRGLFNTKAFEWIENAGDSINEIAPKIIEAVPYMALISGILCIISFVCLMFDRKWEKSKSRLITLGIIAGILVALVILIFAGVISAKGV